jgi:hypothetical protein
MVNRHAARVASLDKAVVGATSLWLNDRPEPPPRRRTYITLGLERGGTSAVAGIQRGLGLYLGEIEKGNNEDAAFTGYRLARIRKAINRRNRAHDVWGFKYPKAVMYMPQIIDNLRNPYFIVVYRDTVATAISHLSWTGKKNRKPANMAVHEANAFSNSNTSFAFSSGRPTLVVSHELVMRKPDEAIDELAGFLGAQPPSDQLRRQIREYIAPGSYKKFEDHFTEVPQLS